MPLPSALAEDAHPLLRYVPKQADAAIVVDHPSQTLDAVLAFEPIQQLLTFAAVKEQLDSTNARRVRQMVAHFEKELGHPWPTLIEKLAGGGACLAVRVEGDPNPSLLVVRAKDEALLHRAVQLVVKAARDELDRQEKPAKIGTLVYRGFTGYQLGDGCLAVGGPLLFASNRRDVVKMAVDLAADGPADSFAGTPHPAAARKLLPGNPHAWLVANLARLQEQPEAKEAYGYPKSDPGQVIVFQGITDVTGRSPFVALGLYAMPTGLQAAVRLPAGRDATPDGLATHFPADGQPGTLPLLEPKNVMLSASFYLDLGKLWTERDRLFDADFRKQLEEADQKLGRFLGGRKLADVLTSVGHHHRVVITHQTESAYSKKPTQAQPAFALVSDLRHPNYATAMNAILRTTALIFGTPARLKYKEEKIGTATLVTYRFPDDGVLPGDDDNDRFNFSPCFAKVGDQFLVASTVELGRELVEKLQQPEINDPTKGSPQSSVVRAYSAGGVQWLKTFEDQLLTQTILDRAVSVAEAKQEVAALVNWLQKLGRLELSSEYGAHEFRLDLRLVAEDKKSHSEARP
jgi:hypothetical protein